MATEWKVSELGQGRLTLTCPIGRIKAVVYHPVFMFWPAAIPTTRCRWDVAAADRVVREHILTSAADGAANSTHNFLIFSVCHGFQF
jgi:hypothetical protein